MPTTRQKKVAEAIVEDAKNNTNKTVKEILVSTGYSVKTAESMPSEIVDSKGVQEELKALGFDELKAKDTVGKIMLNENAKDQDRLKAADMVFKVHGTYAPEKSVNIEGDLVDILKELEKRHAN